MQLKKSCRILKHVLKFHAFLTFLQQNYPSGEACGICFLQHGGGDEEGRKDGRKDGVFNSEEIEKLINLGRKEPVPYNCQSGDYMNKDARAAAVGRIFVALVKEVKLIPTQN